MTRLRDLLQQRTQDLTVADRQKDAFLATLAHELRNPLAPIRNAVSLLQHHTPRNPEVDWGVDVIDRQLRQMTRLVDDLLDLSRITRNTLELRPERLDLAAVLQVAVETSRPLIEAGGHAFVITPPPEPIASESQWLTDTKTSEKANLRQNPSGSVIYVWAWKAKVWRPAGEMQGYPRGWAFALSVP
jgi:signal transduction histidine kinase